MSVDATSAVFALPLPPALKCLALALADHADPQGENIYPSVNRLATMATMSRRSVTRGIQALLKAGVVLLVAEESQHKPREYRLAVSVMTRSHANLARLDVGSAAPPGVVQPRQPGPASRATAMTRKQLLGTETEQPPVAPHLNGYDVKARNILSFLNRKADRHYQPTRINLGYIIARLKEGATEDQCLGVIAMRVRKWKDDAKMREYLRPETLFGAGKFSQYQGELPAEAFSEQEAILG